MMDFPIWDQTENFHKLIHTMQVKYRNQYTQFASLEGDMETLKEMTTKKFSVSLAAIWGTIWWKQSFGTPIVLFRQYGRLFKTHRVFRMYSYSLVALYAYFWVPYNRKLAMTMHKIRDTDKIKSSRLYNNFLVEQPQQTFESGKVMPWRSIN